MIEYSCFDFCPLGVEKKVSMLEDFAHFVDDEFDLSSFADVLIVCARDVIIKHATKDICIKYLYIISLL